jgi:predicted GIY-YIG superfamily endonuclease
MPKKGYTYIVTNRHHTVLYTGATSTLKDRIDRHRSKKYRRSFIAQYNVDKLVWYQEFDWIGDAPFRSHRSDEAPASSALSYRLQPVKVNRHKTGSILLSYHSLGRSLS